MQLAPKIQAKDQPELPNQAQAALEQDKLYWMEPKNLGKTRLVRPIVPGEELPYKATASTMVHVTPSRRSFCVGNEQILVIENELPKRVEKKSKHKAFNVAGLQQVLSARRKARPAPPAEDQEDPDARRAREHARRAAQVATNETKRQLRREHVATKRHKAIKEPTP